MRFQVVTATSIMMAVFWDVALCSLVDTNVLEKLNASHHPDDGGSMLL
jgi:hypothetical protein